MKLYRTKLFTIVHHYTPLENLPNILKEGLNNESRNGRRTLSLSFFLPDTDFMKKDQISWKDAVNKINKHIERNKRINPLIESYNEAAHKYNEKVEDEVIKLIKDKCGKNVDDIDILFGKTPIETERVKEGFYHSPDGLVNDIERIKIKGDNTIKYKKLKDYRQPNIVGLYKDSRYPLHYQQLSLIDGEGGFAQDPHKCLIRLVCDVSEEGRQTETLYNNLEWRITDWNNVITVPPEKIKVQIPFAAVTKDNFNTYLNTIKKIPKEKLDASDAYTRRIAKLMGIDLKKPTVQSTQPTTKEDFVKEAANEQKIVEEKISKTKAEKEKAESRSSNDKINSNNKRVIKDTIDITPQKGNNVKEPVINSRLKLNNLAKAGLVTAGIAGLGLGSYYLYKNRKKKRK